MNTIQNAIIDTVIKTCPKLKHTGIRKKSNNESLIYFSFFPDNDIKKIENELTKMLVDFNLSLTDDFNTKKGVNVFAQGDNEDDIYLTIRIVK